MDGRLSCEPATPASTAVCHWACGRVVVHMVAAFTRGRSDHR
jgi:hypothetical protein